MNKFKIIGAMLIAVMTLAACGGTGNKKKISIAYANWADGIAITHLAKVILEKQGYQVKLLNADIAPIFASVSHKKADLFMDAWLPLTHAVYMKKYGNNLENLGDIYNNACLGLVVPQYVTINSIEELNGVKDRFSSKIVGIDAGAGIMDAADNIIKAYDLQFNLLTSSGPAMTASLKKSIEKKEWIVVTGWNPHWMFSRFDLKMLKDPKNICGKSESIYTIAWKGFSKKNPFAAKLLSNIKLNDKEINSLMEDIADTKTNEDDAVKIWINRNLDAVNQWIPASGKIFK